MHCLQMMMFLMLINNLYKINNKGSGFTLYSSNPLTRSVGHLGETEVNTVILILKTYEDSVYKILYKNKIIWVWLFEDETDEIIC